MAERNTGETTSLGSTADLDLGEIIFSRMPMGIAILDREYCIQRYNPTWAEFSSRYAPPSSAPLEPGVNYFAHVPGSEPVVLPLYERALAGETIHITGMKLEAGGITSYWDVVLSPLIHDDEIIGILNVSVDATQRMHVQQNLEQRVIERTKELEHKRKIAESLRDIIGMINTKLPIDLFLERAVELAAKQLGAAGCILHHFDLANGFIHHQASYGMEGIYIMGEKRSISNLEPYGAHLYVQACLEGKPTYTNFPPLPQRVDLVQKDPVIPEEIKKGRVALREKFAGSFSVPLFIQGEVYGGLAFYYLEPQEFSEEQIDIGMSFAEQVSVAIQNAQLMDKLESAAIIVERNRLARDLHDAVTQTLFSSSLIADVLPKIWERDPEEGKRRLEELRLLTRGALSEMRTLLVELRPTALADTNLKDLIQHQVNAFYARTGVSVIFNPQFQQDPPPKVKEMCYRITQEAFNNIAKHANAAEVHVTLFCLADDVSLEIVDDGIGFNPDLGGTEGLGLGIMKERAENIGGRIEINSQVGKGTSLHITWSGKNNEEQTNER
ncbi:MAG: GAF domain-containing protein [Anaerolineales bacterium]|nr:GAF domain-containing protein [Anaerolineales bacterium]